MARGKLVVAWLGLVISVSFACGVVTDTEVAPPDGADEAAANEDALRVVERVRDFEVLEAAEARGFDVDAGRLVPRLDPPGAHIKRGLVALPLRASDPFSLTDETSGLSVVVTLVGANDAPGEVADGYVVYRAAAPGGVDVVHRVHAEGTEDYLLFEEAPARGAGCPRGTCAEVRYELALGDDVAGLRLVESTLELLDAAGAPRLRMATPYLVDSEGSYLTASVAVDGCAVDVSPAPPWGRPVTAPGRDMCTVRIGWADASYPAVLDPPWTATGSMQTTHRQDNGTTLAPLLDGRVMTAGGLGTSGFATEIAEIYDPSSGTWGVTSSMATTRAIHALAALADGSVLAAGGIHSGFGVLGSAERWDPGTGSWGATGSLIFPRQGAETAVLSDGRVMVTGGKGQFNGYNFSEVYDPIQGTWATTFPNAQLRQYHAAVALPAGQVLSLGGANPDTFEIFASAEIYSPGTNTWAPTGGMTVARIYLAATKLADGRVLVTGGRDGGGNDNLTSEVYDALGVASTPAGALPFPRVFSAQVLLPYGLVLASGSYLLGGSPTSAAAALFDPTDGTWVPTHSMLEPRGSADAILVAGSALVVGGLGPALSGLNTAELYSTALSGIGGVCSHTAQCATGTCADGVCCNTACGGSITTDCVSCLGAQTGLATGTCGTIQLSAGHECRPRLSLCDAIELCNGVGTSCPPDSIEPVGTPCRFVQGPCDVEETCTGTALCPADVFVGGGTLCNAGSGDACDPDDFCSGSGPSCPDTFEPSSTVCSAGSGDLCDPAENCPGVADQSCPADVVAPSTTVCRAGSGDSCNPDELCTGNAGAACPTDTVQGDGTPCPDATFCNGVEQCQTGVCGAPPGDPCAANLGDADTDCSESCDETDDACTADDTAGSTCTDGASDGTCDGSGSCEYADGEPCTTGTECQSSECHDGVCCDIECDGTCDACDLAGTIGVCTPVPEATDIDDECAAGACNGQGACALDDGQACTMASACLSGFCSDGVCCDTACGDGDGADCQACSITTGSAADGVCSALAAIHECRASSGDCDTNEMCDGTTLTCPDDIAAPDGTPCNNGHGLCNDGACEDDPGTGGGGQGGAGQGGTGQGGGGSGTSPPPPADEGCSCEAAGSTHGTARAWLSLAALGLIFARRRAPSRASARTAQPTH